MPDYSSWTSPGGIKVPLLQPISPSLVKPDDALCDICRTIDFKPAKFYVGKEQQDEGDSKEPGENDDDDDSTALSNDNRSNSPRWSTDEGEEDFSEASSDSFADGLINLGNIVDVRSRTRCPFCRLVLAAVGGPRVPDVKNGEPVNVEITIMEDDEAGRGKAARVLTPSVSAGSAWVEEAAVFPEIVPLANDSSGASASLVRPVRQERIDFAMVSNWLSICETFHGDECRKMLGVDGFPVHPATILNEFRLIDVEQNCIVRATSDSKYVALSYVWGQATVLRAGRANIESLEKIGAFDSPEFGPHVPQTVKDAMQASKEIGIRYLWVDALCIIQDEGDSVKLPHIKNMNRIYEIAEFVIVAMSARDANSGLPGVRPWTRDVEQHIEQITPQLRLGVRTAYGNDSAGSTYLTRGWTYQETCFARRQLVFTGGQAVFLCKYAGNWSEDRVVEDSDFVLHEMLNGTDGGPFEGDDDIRSYEAPVQNYSTRVLSYQSDVYAAFAGASQRIRDLLGIDLCHGVPPRYFDWCLLWDPLNQQTRRQGTPSWSWSGWEGGAFPRIWGWYSPKTRDIRNGLEVRTWIVWYHRTAHDSAECRLVWDWGPENEEAREGRNFYGGEVQSRFSIDCSRTQPTERKLTAAPTYYPDILCDAPGSGFLQFWTVSVEFQLDKSDTETWLDNHTRLGIFGSSGRELGTIQVADAWLAKSPGLPLRREFILLCEGRDERADGDDYDGEPGWKYKVMLLEWHGEYAERVAVGSISKGDELEGSPTWKEIILG